MQTHDTIFYKVMHTTLTVYHFNSCDCLYWFVVTESTPHRQPSYINKVNISS